MYKILVVDDELGIRSIIRKYAEFEGHTVYEAGDGMEAVLAFRQNGADIIIMDIMMPELDGFSAVREIRKTSSVPIIMLSARGEEYDKIIFPCNIGNFQQYIVGVERTCRVVGVDYNYCFCPITYL